MSEQLITDYAIYNIINYPVEITRGKFTNKFIIKIPGSELQTLIIIKFDNELDELEEKIVATIGYAAHVFTNLPHVPKLGSAYYYDIYPSYQQMVNVISDVAKALISESGLPCDINSLITGYSLYSDVILNNTEICNDAAVEYINSLNKSVNIYHEDVTELPIKIIEEIVNTKHICTCDTDPLMPRCIDDDLSALVWGGEAIQCDNMTCFSNYCTIQQIYEQINNSPASPQNHNILFVTRDDKLKAVVKYGDNWHYQDVATLCITYNQIARYNIVKIMDAYKPFGTHAHKFTLNPIQIATLENAYVYSNNRSQIIYNYLSEIESFITRLGV